MNETPDFIFNYADTDNLSAELAEWYTYSEEPEFVWNANAFKNTSKKYCEYFFFLFLFSLFRLIHNHNEKNRLVSNLKWFELTRNEKKTHINRLLDETEINNKQHRDEIYRSILYLAQGVFQECASHEDYIRNIVENVHLLYECDAFNIFVDILIFEAK